MVDSPDFIWLRSQNIDHNAMFMTIHGAPIRRETEGKNRYVIARGKFVTDVFDNAKVKITCDGKYRLWVNGKQIGHGPYRSNPYFQRFDTYDISETIKPGENTIAVLVHLPGIDLAWYETLKSAAQAALGDGGLYVETICKNGEETKHYKSDETWRIIETDAWDKGAPLSGWGQDFIEILDMEKLPSDFHMPNFNDNNWEFARFHKAIPSSDAKARGWGEIRPFGKLIDTRCPPITNEKAGPEKLHWVRTIIPRTDLDIKSRLYNEEIGDEERSLIGGFDEFEKLNQAFKVKTSIDRDTALLFSFNPYIVGRPFIEFEANGGEEIEIAVSEALPGEYGRNNEFPGLRNEGKLWVAHICKIKARKGRQYFEKFNPTGIRAMQLVIRNAPNSVIIHDIGVNACHFDFKQSGSFECDNPVLNKIWQIGSHTIQMCAQDGWIDCPGRESRQWLGDGIVMFDMANLAFGPSCHSLHRQFILQIAEGQRGDGLTRMVSPGDIKSNSITIPDYSLHFIIGVWQYFEQSGDIETLRLIAPNLELCANWFLRNSDESGLIANVPEWHFIEWADIDRTGYSSAFNALMAGAFDALSKIYASLENRYLSEKFAKEFSKTSHSLNKYFWNSDRGIFVDSIDAKDLKQGQKTSQHANALALLFEIANQEHIAQISRHLIDEDRLKLTNSPPIMMNCDEFDENYNIVRANSFFAHFVYQGLAKIGKTKWVFDDILRQFGPMIATGTTTLWEAFEPIASLCHGFSATPVYQLSYFGLGLRNIKDQYSKFAIELNDCGLNFAKGKIETIKGSFQIEWQRNENSIFVKINAPSVCEFILKHGQKIANQSFNEDGQNLEIEISIA